MLTSAFDLEEAVMCSEKRLLCKDFLSHFLNYDNIENTVIKQSKEIQIVVNILLTEQNKNMSYVHSKFLKK